MQKSKCCQHKPTDAHKTFMKLFNTEHLIKKENLYLEKRSDSSPSKIERRVEHHFIPEFFKFNSSNSIFAPFRKLSLRRFCDANPRATFNICSWQACRFCLNFFWNSKKTLKVLESEQPNFWNWQHSTRPFFDFFYTFIIFILALAGWANSKLKLEWKRFLQCTVTLIQ